MEHNQEVSYEAPDYAVIVTRHENDIEIIHNQDNRKLIVYPAMWKRPEQNNTIFVSEAHLKCAKPMQWNQ